MRGGNLLTEDDGGVCVRESFPNKGWRFITGYKLKSASFLSLINYFVTDFYTRS